MVDNGNYFIHQPLIISGAGVRGDDEGFTLTGPSASSRTANIQLALSQQSQALLELDDADSMGLRHLSLVGGNIGLLVRNDSVDLQALNVAVRDQIDDGIRIESESVGARLNGVSATRTGGDGIQVTTQIHEIRNGQFSNNAGTGIYLISAQSVIVEGNVVRENSGDGISLSETTASTSRIGQTDLSLGLGNIVERNAGDGIVADGTILVVGNTVGGHQGSVAVGIRNQHGTVSHNVVYDNRTGIDGSTIVGNRVYNNSLGVRLATVNGNVERNTIYSNTTGIQSFEVGSSQFGFTGTIANNLVYDHTLFGLQLATVKAGVAIVNNTIYEPSAIGVSLSNYSDSVFYAITSS